jgi:hypothetical protein
MPNGEMYPIVKILLANSDELFCGTTLPTA